jgi:hypothetical protein
VTTWPPSKFHDRYASLWHHLAADVCGKLGSRPRECDWNRCRFHGVLHTWGFAIYLASRDGYEDNFLPSGRPSGSPEEALDCACGLYLGDPTAWITKPSTD